MRILFDHSVPAPLRHWLRDHLVETTAEHQWERLGNGELLNRAEAEGFDIVLTADKGFEYQQNLRHRRIAVVILSRGNWPDVKMNLRQIVDAVEAAKAGACILVEFRVVAKRVLEENHP
jgi:predicted nuclease of predicted toxin-antitoxin system